jgi:hypothetical protein
MAIDLHSLRQWSPELLFDPTLNDYGQLRGLAPTLEPSGHRGRSARLHHGPKKPIASPEISAALALYAHGWKKSVKQNTAKPLRTIIATMVLGGSAVA